MIIAVGCDHAGYPLKSAVLEAIRAAGHTILDCGADRQIPGDDYPDYAEKVSHAVISGTADRGVLLCGSGVGAAVAANKIRGIRAGLCHDTFSAHQGVEDDSMNVLCLGARVVGPALCEELVRTFLGARFSGAERHERRLRKVLAIEHEESGESSSSER